MVTFQTNEPVLWKGRKAWAEYRSHWAGAFLFLAASMTTIFLLKEESDSLRLFLPLGLFLPALIFPLVAWLDRITHQYKVTTERAILREGFLSRRILEIELVHIRDIRFHQSVVQRIFRTGSLELSSSGRGGAEVIFRGISNPEEVKEMIRRQIRSSGQASRNIDISL